MHKSICKSNCGLCCHVKPEVVINGIKFIPVPEKLAGLNDKDVEMLTLHVCENLDVITKKCKIYDKRPVECRKFFCKGNPRPQVIRIEGNRE